MYVKSPFVMMKVSLTPFLAILCAKRFRKFTPIVFRHTCFLMQTILLLSLINIDQVKPS